MEWYDGFIWYNGCGINQGSGGTAVAEVTSCGGSAEMTGDMEVGFPVVGITETITVLVRKVGTYNYWASANGITFVGMGYFGSVGVQKVVLTASGTPLDDGSYEFRLDSSSGCTFIRRVDGVLSTIVSATGRTWEDRNLGADHVASSVTDYTAYGSLFQWGRAADGHEVVEWLGPGGG